MILKANIWRETAGPERKGRKDGYLKIEGFRQKGYNEAIAQTQLYHPYSHDISTNHAFTHYSRLPVTANRIRIRADNVS